MYNMDCAEYETIRRDTLEGINRFAQHGIPTGGFLEAVLSNNLVKAVSRADASNLFNLPDIVKYCYNEIPADCWGSEEKYVKWLEYMRQLKNEETPSGVEP